MNKELLQQAVSKLMAHVEINHIIGGGQQHKFEVLVAQLISTAIAQPASQGFQCEPQPAVTDDGFCEWVCPKPMGYLMQCCDCGLIHEVESRVAKFQPRPSEEFVIVDDADLQAQWRMKRRDDLTAEGVGVAQSVSPAACSLAIGTGAIYDFAGFLTTREKRVILSGYDEAGPAAEAIKEFFEKRGIFNDVTPAIKDWHEIKLPVHPKETK